MKTPTKFSYTVELHGAKKLWAKLRRKPWSWTFTADVEFDPRPRTNEDGSVSFDFKPIGPITREANG